MIVFETFGEQDAKTGNAGEKFRMSEPQRVCGTAVDSYFCESRGNLVSNASIPPFIPHNLENHFRVFRVFRGSLATSLEFIIQPRKSRKARKKPCPRASPWTQPYCLCDSISLGAIQILLDNPSFHPFQTLICSPHDQHPNITIYLAGIAII